MTTPPIEAPADRWRVLVVLCLSLTLVMLANGSVNIALPSLAQQLGASASELQWVVDAYALAFAGLLFTAGAVGDRFGRKGALQGGLVLFLAGTVLATVAGDVATVVAARATMGVGAAFVMPSTLSIITQVFPAQERARAISTWAGVAAGGAALGPTLTGLLLEHFWWGSVFLLNVPVVVLALVLGRRLVPTSRRPGRHPLDVAGAALSTVAVGAAVFAIIESPHRGLASPPVLAALTVAALALAGFVARERSAAHPMLDLGLLRDVRFRTASVGIGASYFALFGGMYLITQYLQLVLGVSPVRTGLLMLPLSAVVTLLSPRAPALVARFGIARVVPAGLACSAAGLALVGALGPEASEYAVVAGLVLMAAGISSASTPLTTQLMASVPLERAGMGSATNDTTRELGGALGVAVLGALLSIGYTAGAGDLAGAGGAAGTSVGTGLAGALEVAATLPAAVGEALADGARAAFTDGLRLATWSAAVLLCGVAVALARRLPRP